MKDTVVVCGYGPGIGHAVATRFGAAGFSAALLGRRTESVEQGAADLSAVGIKARGFTIDLSDPQQIKQVLAKIERTLGPVVVLHWNAVFSGGGDLMSAGSSELRHICALAIEGPIAAAQAAHRSLKRTAGRSAFLLTGGGLARDSADSTAVEYGMMGIALSKATHRKLAGLLHKRLRHDGIYVAELAVHGMVKTTERPLGTIAPEAVAERLFAIYQARAGRFFVLNAHGHALGALEDNERLVRSWLDAFPKLSKELFLQFIHEEMVNHAVPVTIQHGRKNFMRVMRYILSAAPDQHYRCEHIVASSDMVHARVRWLGTFSGEYLGVQGNGQRFDVEHYHTFRVRDGQLIEHWAVRDDLSLFRQTGVSPPRAL